MPLSQDWLTASAWAFSIMTWTLLITQSLLKRLLLLLVSQPQITSNLQIQNCLASLSIRNTPPARHTFSPAQRLFGRSPHSDLPRPAASLEPSTPPRDTVVADHGHRKLKQKNAYDKHTSAPLSALPPGNYVYAKPPLTTSKAWIPRKMVGHAGPRSYLIDTGKSRISRNRVQVQLAPPQIANILSSVLPES